MFLRLLLLLAVLPPSLLALPSTLNPRSLANSMEKRYLVYCFKQQYGRQLQLPIAADCWHAAEQIVCGDKYQAPMEFTHSPKPGFWVPWRWTHGTCIIQIDLEPGSEAVDVTSLADIAERAVEMIRSCVVHSSKLGGRTTAGQLGLIHLMVSGALEANEEVDGPVTPYFLKPSDYVPNPYILAQARANCGM